MTSGDTRRAFLSALLLTGGSVAAFGKSFQSGPSPPAGAQGDALFEHIQAQLASLLRHSRQRGGWLTAEDATTAAAFMRVCGIHARGLQLDDAARRLLASRVAALGRDRVLNLSPDLAELRSRMRRKGLPISERLLDQASKPDLPIRTLALQAVQSGQTTQVCDRLAEALEHAAPTLAGDRRSIRRVAAPDRAWCNGVVAQQAIFLQIAWYIASFPDPTLEEFLDALWAGFVTCEQLHQQQC
jgi:hypothetical protein